MANRVSSKARSGFWGEVEITAANLKSSHFYLRGFLDRFPGDLIGGPNDDDLAPKSATVDWGGSAPVKTDIAGDKKFFRRRAWIGDFFSKYGASAGDRVRVEETAPYRYRVTLVKKGAP